MTLQSRSLRHRHHRHPRLPRLHSLLSTLLELEHYRQEDQADPLRSLLHHLNLQPTDRYTWFMMKHKVLQRLLQGDQYLQL